MAISKVIYKTSAEDTGTVWMDVTQKTVTAGSMLSGTTALKNDGTDITGNIASKTSSDLTANVLTVTAPAGHYASAATKTLTDQNLLAGNIKKDVQIFGVTGTYEGGGGGTSWETVYNGTQYISADWGDGTYYTMLNSWSETIDLNSVWRITWDGTPYECTATWAGSSDGDPCAIGNYTYDGGSGGTDYPFFMQVYWSTNLAIVTAVSGSHTIKIEKQVSGGGSTGLEYETGTWTPVEDTLNPVITFTNTHSDLPFSILMSDTTGTFNDTNYSMAYWEISNWYSIHGNIPSSATAYRYAYVRMGNRSTSWTGYGYEISALNSSSTGDLGYWVTSSNFTPHSRDTSTYWRSGRTYKWIAVWAPST